eukprot:gene23293-10906_t
MSIKRILAVLFSTAWSAALAVGNHVPEWSEWDKAAGLLADPTEQECLAYLRKYAPLPDRTSPNITADFLVQNVQLALEARNATSWGRAVPKALFLNEVLPYAMMSEPRGVPDWSWRPQLMHALLPQVQAMPNASAAAEAGINTLSWDITAAPNCQINAIFVVAAMRAVGIPARVA